MACAPVRVWLIIFVMVALAGVLAWRLTKILGDHLTDAKTRDVPTVTVTEVGRSTTPTIISIIGTIAARYDMPIGVQGDAGRIEAIYVEAGDHVKKGQLLVRLDVSVLEPQVANLQASLECRAAAASIARFGWNSIPAGFRHWASPQRR